VGSNPDGVIGIFYGRNPSHRTMVLGLIQPLTEMSTRNISWGGGWRRPVRRADSLTTFMYHLSWNLGASTSWNTQGQSRPVMGLFYLFIPNGVLRNVFSPNFIWGFSTFLSRTISALRLSTFYCLHSNKTSTSFPTFTLFAHLVIVMSVHILYHVFAFCSVFRVE